MLAFAMSRESVGNLVNDGVPRALEEFASTLSGERYY